MGKDRARYEKSVEIILIFLGVFAVIFCLAHFADTFKSFLPNNTMSLSKSSDHSTEIYNALTVEVNAINNILTWGSFLVAVLTIATAVFGILSVSAFREETRNNIKSSNKEIDNIKIGLTKAFNEFSIDQNTRLDNLDSTIHEHINDANTRLDNFIRTINENTDIVNRYTTQIDIVREALNQQARYFDHAISYLYQATYSNISLMEDQVLAQQLLDNLYHELQITTLYSVDLDANDNPNNNINKIAALEYLIENGTMADIQHLDYVENHDPNEHIRRRAIEVRAIIQNRNNNQGNTTLPVAT